LGDDASAGMWVQIVSVASARGQLGMHGRAAYTPRDSESAQARISLFVPALINKIKRGLKISKIGQHLGANDREVINGRSPRGPEI